ncbi:flp pilus assembly protein CpaB [Bacillaceae bacterium Marseille-Q3522]|nr:flp pilus assembly protein CpaB [Bacillaceae bacterium Marseille-Q3522]
MLESKKRATIFLILAFIFALIAGYLVLQKVRELNAELGGMTEIYIANGDIPARTLIEEGQITTTEIPNKFVNPAHVTKAEDIIGSVLVVPASKGDIITMKMLKPYSNTLEENNRLVALYSSDKVQFDQVIEALDRVDIIVSTSEGEETKTEVFMSDVPVAYSQGDAENFAGVALEVNKDDAPQLIHMQNYADHIRVLKANVGKDEMTAPPETEETDSGEEAENSETQNAGNNAESNGSQNTENQTGQTEQNTENNGNQ